MFLSILQHLLLIRDNVHARYCENVLLIAVLCISKEMGSLYVVCECSCLHCSWMVKCFFVRKLKERQEGVKDFFPGGRGGKVF